MCLIITRNKGGQVNWDGADRAARRNPDGYGIAYVGTDNKINVFKSMEWSAVRNVATMLQHKDLKFILHMRYATHGAVILDNCHPFKLERHDSVMMHNGMLHSIDTPQGESDSKVMAEHLDNVMDFDFLNDEVEVSYIKDLLEERNKLTFLDKDDNITIVNEHLGQWVDGCWYSAKGVCQTNSNNNYNPKAQKGWNSVGLY